MYRQSFYTKTVFFPLPLDYHLIIFLFQPVPSSKSCFPILLVVLFKQVCKISVDIPTLFQEFVFIS